MFQLTLATRCFAKTAFPLHTGLGTLDPDYGDPAINTNTQLNNSTSPWNGIPNQDKQRSSRDECFHASNESNAL